VGEQQVVVRQWHANNFAKKPHVPPLPRNQPRPAQPTPSRGRGRGWGNNKLSFRRSQAQALKGLSILALGSHRRWIPRVPKKNHVPPLPRNQLRQAQTTPSRGRGRGWGKIKLSSRRWPANDVAKSRTSPLSRETSSTKHKRHRRGGGAGGGGTTSCRPAVTSERDYHWQRDPSSPNPPLSPPRTSLDSHPTSLYHLPHGMMDKQLAFRGSRKHVFEHRLG
jgi:hypothetical protein